MFNSDLDVFARTGFPQTAERIKEALRQKDEEIQNPRAALEQTNKEQKCNDPRTQLFCGDKVIYPECFGDKELVFVGMAEQLSFNNDCVITYNGDACPVRRSGLVKLAT